MEEVYIIKLDKNCRIVIPVKVRKEMRIRGGSSVKLTYKNKVLSVEAEKENCIICHGEKDVVYLKDNDVYMCENCIKKIKNYE